jgi:glycosyltransferase involved in cell wall biosynthesis
MKILFFINGIYLGGKERRLVELMKQIQLNSQFEFELVVMDSEINYPEILDLKIKTHYLIRKSKKDLSVFTQLYSLCKKFQPDIIHCWDGMTAVYSIPICKLLHIKLVNGMVVNCPPRDKLFNKRFLHSRLSFPFSDIIIGNSKAGLNAYNAAGKKSIVIHNGYNFKRSEDLIEKYELREQLKINTKYIVGMVATFSKSKDYPTFFKAAEIVLKERNDITFLAIGNKTDSLEAKKLVNEKWKKYFRFLGKKSEIESFINLMDIGVLSTFTEGISNSIMEYMALGKAVIATVGGGTNEIIKNKSTGFLVNVSDPQDLANKIKFLIENENGRIEMGLKGKERIENFFSIDSMINQYISVYNNLLHQGKLY